MTRTWKASRGLEFESIRFRHDDTGPAYFAGEIEEAKNSAGLRVPSPQRGAFLTKRRQV